MLQFLINLLTPIFEGMGVTPIDVVPMSTISAGIFTPFWAPLCWPLWSSWRRSSWSKKQASSGGLGRRNPIYGGSLVQCMESLNGTHILKKIGLGGRSYRLAGINAHSNF